MSVVSGSQRMIPYFSADVAAGHASAGTPGVAAFIISALPVCSHHDLRGLFTCSGPTSKRCRPEIGEEDL